MCPLLHRTAEDVGALSLRILMRRCAGAAQYKRYDCV
jgi:hypothetical protein